ncbi:substrate-binding periplasmic protein [Pigmentibacter ruber]|uniref:substrate-binding periplasmic protein n=1 Tax=Pigmentibacter ruber TaxID=2683196 RepID=UPI00131E41FB|nr:transporter substrate-binding domain-containing protein [Pigmentibacter ruber]BFD32050.1 hypothetical protein GTC16762_16680 [Pigmentibacter ruber]
MLISYLKKMILPLLLLYSSNCIATDEKLLITGNEARAPKIYLDEEHHPKGYLIEIMNIIAKEINLTIEYKLQNWPKAVEDASLGKYAIIGFSRSNERLKTFDFSEEPLYYDKIIVVTTQKNPLKFESYEDLKNKKIAVIRGTNYGYIFEKMLKENGFKHVETYSLESQLELLLKDKIDGFLIGSGTEGLYSAIRDSKNPVIQKRQNEFRILKKPFNLDPNYIAILKSRNQKPLLNKIDEALKKLKADGKLIHIYGEK